MDKETSARVSSIAAKYTNFRPPNLMEIVDSQDPDKFNEFCADVRTLAGSALSQDQTPGQGEIKTTARYPLEVVGVGSYFLAEVADDDEHVYFHCEGMEPRLIDEDDLADFWEMLAQDGAPNEEVVFHRPAPEIGQEKSPVASEQPIGEPVEIGGHDEDRDGPVSFSG